MNNWYEVKAKFTKQLEDGRLKRVTDTFLIDAVSHTDAEERAWNELLDQIPGEVIVTGITPKVINDIIANDEMIDYWWMCVVGYTAIDADNGYIKHIKSNILVSADRLDQAVVAIIDFVKDWQGAIKLHSIKETSIVEVLPYKPSND